MATPRTKLFTKDVEQDSDEELEALKTPKKSPSKSPPTKKIKKSDIEELKTSPKFDGISALAK